jgi:uncharacterized protein (TIGR02284 family)
MDNNNKIIDQLNEILRGERSAAETYVQVLEKIGDEPQSDTVRKTKAEHMEAVKTWKTKIQELGGQPSESSGAWGTWAQTVAGTSKIFGDKSALEALKQGEEHGLKLYKELIDDCEPDTTVRSMAENHIQIQQKHIQMLENYQNNI